MTTMQPISRPLQQLKSEYTVVVVGSGYGGGIAASRMARAKQKDGAPVTVCVLERGREILPGQLAPPNYPHTYPNTLTTLAQEAQIETKTSHFGDNTALVDLRVGDDVCVVVGCGLGGTSLINANVALAADKRVFSMEAWPQAFREQPKLLDDYYDRARLWLGSNPYPGPETEAKFLYPHLNKVEALKTSAKAMRQPFYYPPINVTFQEGRNHAGVHQNACVACGDCVSGCNYGAKNTTLMNYLPDAYRHGAEIFTCAKVQHLERTEAGWKVYVENLQEPTAQPLVVTADIVILAAGTLGSTEILLRSREKGMPISDRIGARFSCNGDVLAFGYNTDWTKGGNQGQMLANISLGDIFGRDGDQRHAVYGVGAGSQSVAPPPLRQQTPLQPGPCIAGIIDMRDQEKLEDGLVIEEGVIPGAFASIMPPMLFFADALEGNFFEYGDTKLRLEDAQQLGNAILNDPANMAEESYRGPVSRTQTYLVMSHDSANGQIVLENNRAQVKWPGVGGEPVYSRNDQILKEANAAVRGMYVPNPLWSDALQKRVVTVHPIGGCPMADHGAAGVVNDKCQVFCDSSSPAVYENLYVCDGAVIPSALGVNPLLTISAVAERACELLAKDRGWRIDYEVAEAPSTTCVAASTETVESGNLIGKLEKKVETILVDNAFVAGKLKDLVMKSLTSEIEKNSQEKIQALTKDLQGQIEETLLHEVQAALRERAPTEVAEEVRRQKVGPFIDYLLQYYSSPNDDLFQRLMSVLTDLVNEFPVGFSPSLSFTERMSGFFSEQTLPPQETNSTGITSPFTIAHKYGEANKAQGGMTAVFTVAADNLYMLIHDSTHQATLTGTVVCPALSAQPMTVTNGRFRLLVVDPDRVETWTMIYSMELQKNDGAKVYCEGRKILHQEPGSNPWLNLTTLYVTVFDHQDGTVIGRGILTLSLDDLIRQGSTMTMAIGTVLNTLQEELKKLLWGAVWTAIEKPFAALVDEVRLLFAAQCIGFFGNVIFRAYGGLLADLEDFPSQDDRTRMRRPLKAPTPEVHRFRTEDKVELQLTRYCGGKAGPVILAPGIGVRASSYAGDTTPTSLVEYLTSHDFDVWLFDYRASPVVIETTPPFTLDDIAVYDWPAATRYLCDVTGRPDMQAIVHCVGSLSFLMALLLGLKGIRSAICSQFTLHPVTNWQNHLKTDIRLTDILSKVFHLSTVDICSSPSPEAKALDAWLWNVPVPEGEACKNPVCHRNFAIYGMVYAHDQLNALTHDALREMFGQVQVKPFEQLSLILKNGHAVDCRGHNTYLRPENAKHMILPLTFIHGMRNQIFYPETSALTLEWLRRENPQADAAGLYKRHVFPDYAHMDLFIGKKASDEIFPFLLEELKARE